MDAVKFIITSETGISIRRSPSSLISSAGQDAAEQMESDKATLLAPTQPSEGKILLVDKIVRPSSEVLLCPDEKLRQPSRLGRRLSETAVPTCRQSPTGTKILEGGGFLVVPQFKLSVQETETPSKPRPSSMIRRHRSQSMQMPSSPVRQFNAVTDDPVDEATMALLPPKRPMSYYPAVSMEDLNGQEENNFVKKFFVSSSKRGSHYGSTELCDGDVPLDSFDIDTPPRHNSSWSFGG